MHGLKCKAKFPSAFISGSQYTQLDLNSFQNSVTLTSHLHYTEACSGKEFESKYGVNPQPMLGRSGRTYALPRHTKAAETSGTAAPLWLKIDGAGLIPSATRVSRWEHTKSLPWCSPYIWRSLALGFRVAVGISFKKAILLPLLKDWDDDYVG